MIWEQGSGLGHMTTMLPIAEQLHDRGHQVFVALKDFSSALKVFDPEKFHLLPCPAFSSLSKNNGQASTFAQIMHNVGFGNCSTLEPLVNSWHTIFDLVKPQLVITDHSPVAMLAARARGLKTITLGTGFSCPAACSQYPNWRPDEQNSLEQLSKDENLVLRNANSVLQRHGAPKLNTLSDLYRETDDALLVTYPELDPFQDRENGDYLGLLPDKGGVDPTWPESKAKRVFAYLRPLRGVELLLDTLIKRNLSVIVRMPKAPGQLKSRFPTIVWEEQFVDLSLAAEQAEFCIGHGTHMMTAKWLLAGKPVVMLPPYLEQCLTAKQIVNMGAGTASSLKTPRRLIKAIDTLLHEPVKFSKAAQAFANKYKTSPATNLAKAMEKVYRVLETESTFN